MLVSSASSLVLPTSLQKTLKHKMVLTGTQHKARGGDVRTMLHTRNLADELAEHHGKDKDSALSPCPEADFDSFLVVVIFQGKSGSNHGMRVIEVAEERRIACDSATDRHGTKPESASPPEEFQIDWKDWDTQSYALSFFPDQTRCSFLKKTCITSLAIRQSGKNTCDFQLSRNKGKPPLSGIGTRGEDCRFPPQPEETLRFGEWHRLLRPCHNQGILSDRVRESFLAGELPSLSWDRIPLLSHVGWTGVESETRARGQLPPIGRTHPSRPRHPVFFLARR